MVKSCGTYYTPAVVICLVVLQVLSQRNTYKIDDSNGYGRRFDGIGAISGGGATSKLLVNYAEQQRNEILDYLFKPNYGASLQILKVEIGGDDQSSDGGEPSHMHESWDENYQRGYEWWLMVEAKKRNPEILLYGLPWAFPGWIGHGTFDVYAKPEVTVDYIIRWITGAKTYHNLSIDYIGIWNERNYNTTYIKLLRKTLDQRGLAHVRICAADDAGWQFADAVLQDPELANAIDFIGSHYPNTMSTDDAVKTGKQLWASEDAGGSCRAAVINQNYVNGDITGSISWSLITSYYPGLPYPGSGLMTANEPWGGNYVVEKPIWMTAHSTQFTKPGWKYLKHGSGVGKLAGGGSYVAFTDQEAKELTIVIETLQCSTQNPVSKGPNKPSTMHYLPTNHGIVTQNVTFNLLGSFAHLTLLNLWYSNLTTGNNQSTLFNQLPPVQVTNGIIELTLGMDEVYTLTTLTSGQKGAAPDPPASQPFPLPYIDDFNEYQLHSGPDNLSPQIGMWEVVDLGPPHNGVIRQMVLERPVYWCWFWISITNTTLNVIGDYEWADVYVQVDARVGQVNGTDGVYVAARIDQGGCHSILAKGIFFFVYPLEQKFEVTNDLARLRVLTSGSVDATADWNTLALLLKGNVAAGMLNGKQLFNIIVPDQPTHGFVGLGSVPYGIADFDNLEISRSEAGSRHLQTERRGPTRLLYKPKSKQ